MCIICPYRQPNIPIPQYKVKSASFLASYKVSRNPWFDTHQYISLNFGNNSNASILFPPWMYISITITVFHKPRTQLLPIHLSHHNANRLDMLVNVNIFPPALTKSARSTSLDKSSQSGTRIKMETHIKCIKI